MDRPNATIIVQEPRVQESYTQVPNTILTDPDLSMGAKLTYAMLLKYAWFNNQVFPGQTTLAQDLGCAERSVRTYLVELEKAALLQVKQRGLGQTNLYTLLEWVKPRPANFADPEWQPTSDPDRQILPLKKTKKETHEVEEGVDSTASPFSLFVSDFSREFGDTNHLKSNQTRMERLFAKSGRSVEEFRELLYEARARTKRTPNVSNKMAYFFRCLEELLHPSDEKPLSKGSKTRLSKSRTGVVSDDVAEHGTADAEAERRRRPVGDRQRYREGGALRQELPRRDTQQAIPGTNLTTTTAWEQVLAELKEQITRANFNTWLKETALLSCADGTAVIGTTSSFQQEWLENRVGSLISKTLRSVLGQPVTSQFIVVSQVARAGEGESPATTEEA